VKLECGEVVTGLRDWVTAYVKPESIDGLEMLIEMLGMAATVDGGKGGTGGEISVAVQKAL